MPEDETEAQRALHEGLKEDGQRVPHRGQTIGALMDHTIDPTDADMDRLNAQAASDTMPDTAQGKLDLAEYLIAGVLEAGPDNGVEDDFIKDLDRAWDLLIDAHPQLNLRPAFYHPTS